MFRDKKYYFKFESMAISWKDLRPFDCVCGRVKNKEKHFTCACFAKPLTTEEDLNNLKIDYSKKQILENENEISEISRILEKLKKEKADYEEALQEIGGHLFSQKS